MPRISPKIKIWVELIQEYHVMRLFGYKIFYYWDTFSLSLSPGFSTALLKRLYFCSMFMLYCIKYIYQYFECFEHFTFSTKPPHNRKIYFQVLSIFTWSSYFVLDIFSLLPLISFYTQICCCNEDTLGGKIWM